MADPPEDRENAITSAPSDSMGRFRLEAPSGYWLLRVAAGGSRTVEEDHLRAGDFRWVRLEAAIELLVHVVDGSGDAIRGARVELVHDEYMPSHRAVAHADTGPGGTANLSVPSGAWTLAVRHPEHRPHFERLAIAPGATRVERDIVLASGIRVFGQVSMMGNASPPAGTRVVLDSIYGFQESLEVACDPDGGFRTGHCFSSDQTLEVAALAAGFAEVRKQVDLGPLDGEKAGDVEVRLSLERRDRSARGRVVDTAGRPVTRASVFLKPLLALPPEREAQVPARADLAAELDLQGEPQESYQAQWRWVTRTDERGEFRVGGMNSDRPYSLLLVPPLHGNVRLWIEAAEPPRDVDFGTIVVPDAARIHGVVRARDGRSVADLQVATVWLDRVRLRAGTSFKTRRAAAFTGGFQTVTNAEGQFALEPLPEGEFYLQVADEQFGPFALSAGESRGPEILEIGGVPGADTISGTIVDDQHEPLESGFVQLFRQRSASALELLAATSVGSSGEFRLPAQPPGPFLFRALDLAGGCLQTSVPFDCADDWRPGSIVLVPDPRGAAAVRGKVLDRFGAGLQRMNVTLHVSPAVTSCTCVSRTVSTDEAGAFDFGPLVAGAHRLVVVDPEGRHRAQDRFPVQPGELVELILED